MRSKSSAALLLAVLVSSTTVSGQLVCEPGESTTPPASCILVTGSGDGCTSSRDALTATDAYNAALVGCFGEKVNLFQDPGGCEHCPGSASGVPGPEASNISAVFLPLNYRFFNLSVRLPEVSGVAYEVRVYGNDELFCACCTGETSHNFTLAYTPGVNVVTFQLQVLAFPGGEVFYKDLAYPENCAQVPYDVSTCGLPRLETPTNVSLECNGSHTTISWSRAVSYISPAHETVFIDVDTFYLTIRDCDNQQTRFVVRNTSTVTVNTSAVTDLSIHAYSQCSGLYQYREDSRNVSLAGCSLPTYCAGTSYCRSVGPRTCYGRLACEPPSVTISHPLPTPQNTIVFVPPSVERNFLPVYIATGIAGAILILVTAVVIVIFIVRRPPPPPPPWYDRIPGHSPSPPPRHSAALVIYSPSTQQQEKNVVLQGFADMHNLRVGVESLLQDARRPQDTLVTWISDNYARANAVFCVCNREFKSDWETGAPSEDSSVAVQTLRLLFEGDLGSVELKKYAVVLSKPTDEEFIPPLLKSLPRINLADTPALAKFAGREHSPV